MFESDQPTAEIMLCIFPHLKEFVVVDARPDRPGGPTVLNLSLSNVLGDKFFADLESDFSKIIRRHDIGFLELMAIPQQVEAVIRSVSHRRIVEELGLPEPVSGDQPGSVGVLFFAGSLLGFDSDQLRGALREMFSSKLGPIVFDELCEQLLAMADQERKSVSDNTPKDLAGLITGESAQYVTLWESRQN